MGPPIPYLHPLFSIEAQIESIPRPGPYLCSTIVYFLVLHDRNGAPVVEVKVRVTSRHPWPRSNTICKFMLSMVSSGPHSPLETKSRIVMRFRSAIWRTARVLLGVLITATAAAQTSATRFAGIVVDPAGQYVAGA